MPTATLPSSGSPPLARGPLVPGEVQVNDRRLTPARAGTTSIRAVPRTGRTAHPRSRGDHRASAIITVKAVGSPLLARGPHHRAARRKSDPRLTPARAGTTKPHAEGKPAPSAHPRSRGDHGRPFREVDVDDGSPPLARGPHFDALLDEEPLRLTPARAGTTRGSRAARVAGPAHPRSRGDHDVPGEVASAALGSPPLARGPPPRTVRRRTTRRLTPARAGTTSWPPTTAPCRSAHPRSRGDHVPTPCAKAWGGGSPPLARGPRQEEQGERVEVRLTPARAGTTPERLPACRVGTAHPRSRGDHMCEDVVVVGIDGSPPLARGPRTAGLRRRGHPRLTPARAGTTPTRWRGCTARTAHPRSRGDHAVAGIAMDSAGGSPPLARGPRNDSGHLRRRPRLTPARAGTTPWGRTPRTRSTAHPRSRGDHIAEHANWFIGDGSPPLARGPQESSTVVRPGMRLTPARAGTTETAHAPVHRGSAHPRSRGDHLPPPHRRKATCGSPPLARGPPPKETSDDLQ